MQFEQFNYIDNLESIVRNSGLSPSRLKLEITESAIMHNTKDAIERIKEIKQRLPGIAFMVDDFGTGYSSLAYLSRLPIDALKIDISFVMHLAELQNEKVVNAIINLGHSLDLDIVVEGIETEEQWTYFEERKCGALQGFFFMKAADIDNICDFINRGPIKREVALRQAILEPPAILISKESMGAMGVAGKAAMAENRRQEG
jgi:EAL domain-containing protein (putative c-di-GMP-specific phosphodiesterase class I)